MPKNTPKANEEKMRKMLNAWETLASKKSFGGMTLDQFQTATALPLDSRARLEVLQNQVAAETSTRDDEDEKWFAIAKRVIAGVAADPTEGTNSPLYEAMGRVRDSERKSGLTKKKGGGSPPTPTK
jgi:hypothetical protein